MIRNVLRDEELVQIIIVARIGKRRKYQQAADTSLRQRGVDPRTHEHGDGGWEMLDVIDTVLSEHGGVNVESFIATKVQPVLGSYKFGGRYRQVQNQPEAEQYVLKKKKKKLKAG